MPGLVALPTASKLRPPVRRVQCGKCRRQRLGGPIGARGEVARTAQLLTRRERVVRLQHGRGAPRTSPRGSVRELGRVRRWQRHTGRTRPASADGTRGHVKRRRRPHVCPAVRERLGGRARGDWAAAAADSKWMGGSMATASLESNRGGWQARGRIRGRPQVVTVGEPPDEANQQS